LEHAAAVRTRASTVADFLAFLIDRETTRSYRSFPGEPDPDRSCRILAQIAEAQEERVPKGYLISQIRIHDPETYRRYAAQVAATLSGYDARFLVRGGTIEPLEGEGPPPRTVVLEFPSLTRAREWYYSDGYQALIPIRQSASVANSFLVEGADESR
jgi:uncharacterized protein (DUF1330 family)